MAKKSTPTERSLEDFFTGKPQEVRRLFDHFVGEYQKIGDVSVHTAKTMIGIATPRKRITYVTQIGKNFIHIVFPFDRPYPDNLCFQKIAKVPGDDKQFNHHLRLLTEDDLNDEVRSFMRLAFEQGKARK